LIENKVNGGIFAAKVFLKDVIFHEKTGKVSGFFRCFLNKTFLGIDHQ